MKGNGRHKSPVLVVRGMENIIKKDLDKHKSILEQLNVELLSFRQARSYEIKKRKYYKSLIGGEKYNDEALKKSIDGINVNIQHFSNKVKEIEDKIDFNKHIVDKLSNDLMHQNNALKLLAEDHKNRN